MYPALIGITGTRGSGKDTLARALRDHGFVRAAFADKLKLVAMDLYQLTAAQVHGSQEEKETIDPRWGVSPRFILQQLGTEVGRSVHTETWTRYLLDVDIPERNQRMLAGLFGGFAITDVRFPSEAEAIRARGGIIVRVVRSSKDDPSSYARHASEAQVADLAVEAEYINDGGLDKFAEFARHAAQLVRAHRARGGLE